MRYQLELISLQCIDALPEDDAPYILVNGKIEWGPTPMKTGDNRVIGKLICFDSHITIELYELDGVEPRKPSGDIVGKINLCETKVQQLIHGYVGGGLVVDFHCDKGVLGDAKYRLTYELDEV